MTNVGLDFGTHQTKVCWEHIDASGNAIYTFFSFIDLNGNEKFALPSVVQLNEDDTLSYGFVDESRCKYETPVHNSSFDLVEPKQPKLQLPKKPEVKNQNEVGSKTSLASALKTALLNKLHKKSREQEQREWEEQCIPFKIQYEKALKKYEEDKKKYDQRYNEWLEEQERNKRSKCIYRNFKQATFLGPEYYPWEYAISSEQLSVWYLANLFFLLEDYYQRDPFYSIQMGVPTGNTDLEARRRKAVALVAAAFHLIEHYSNDYVAFKAAKLSELAELTDLSGLLNEKAYEENKYYYNIKVFPEAFAGLLVMTTQSVLSSGFNLLVDIGGGTTDISFFATTNSSKRPMIYNYDSVPKGLNYLFESAAPANWNRMAEHPTSDLLDKDKLENAKEEHRKGIEESVKHLLLEIYRKRVQSAISKTALGNTLVDRPVIYNGGGSCPKEIMMELDEITERFTDVRSILFISNKQEIENLVPILSVSLGLAISQESDEIKLYELKDIFEPHRIQESDEPHDYGHDKDLQDL